MPKRSLLVKSNLFQVWRIKPVQVQHEAATASEANNPVSNLKKNHNAYKRAYIHGSNLFAISTLVVPAKYKGIESARIFISIPVFKQKKFCLQQLIFFVINYCVISLSIIYMYMFVSNHTYNNYLLLILN